MLRDIRVGRYGNGRPESGRFSDLCLCTSFQGGTMQNMNRSGLSAGSARTVVTALLLSAGLLRVGADRVPRMTL